jgi:predicted glycogen debranching enzyme
LAADQFVIIPQTRPADAARAHARGDEARTIIAGYHWFTDWGRDTMIALEGLTLITGRAAEAGCILRTFANHVEDGLIPNLFPEGHKDGLYHTADATLWFVHAIERYVAATGDVETRRAFMPTLRSILEAHVRGTRFNIRVDPADGLLSQGAPGYQLTWMDAKVGDWVVTPRRGKAVEINALFYNAVRLIEGWAREDGDGDLERASRELAERAYAAFNARFWCERVGHLYDVVDGESGDDASLRPNQLFAVSLAHPVLDPSRWRAVVESVRRELLTPVGLRSLSPRAPDYKATYDGDRRSRDAAYHQGTVWAWLAGAYVDAWLRVYPHDVEGAARVLEGIESHAHDACLGTVSEIFDGDAPYHPRGCVAQAWSVAETLRAITKLSRVEGR